MTRLSQITGTLTVSSNDALERFMASELNHVAGTVTMSSNQIMPLVRSLFARRHSFLV